MVSAGAALALANTMTARQFLARAALALNIHDQGDPLMVLLDSNNNSYRVTHDLTNHKGATISIACYPLPTTSNRADIDRFDTYCLEALEDKAKKGTHTWELKYDYRPDDAAGQDWLILHHEFKAPNKTAVTKLIEWPIFYDHGACCLFIDRDRQETRPGHDNQITGRTSQRIRNKKGCRAGIKWRKEQMDQGARYWGDLFEPSTDDDELGSSGEADITVPTNSNIVPTIEGNLFVEDDRPVSSTRTPTTSAPPVHESSSVLISPTSGRGAKTARRGRGGRRGGRVPRQPRSTNKSVPSSSQLQQSPETPPLARPKPKASFQAAMGSLTAGTAVAARQQQAVAQGGGSPDNPYEILDEVPDIISPTALASRKRKRAVETVNSIPSRRNPFALMVEGQAS